ncbi:MAG: winged helix-turn-helix domain-containing protein [Candidatus Moranbacteria bacterium]|nr:winged helix-turn-helix domain-containing protein [Candidatus Moranbacteria bacterium]
MTETQAMKDILIKVFPPVHVTALLNHFTEAITKFQQEDWEGALAKSSKFVESFLKAIRVYTGGTLPPSRQFKVNNIVNELCQLSGSSYDDVLRLTMPRACTFVYDIVSNRGTRHDSEDFDPNKMDADVVMPIISWLLAEMLRFSNQTQPDNADVMALTESLMEKRHPIFETIDGRTYINHKGLSPKDLAILLLYAKYPNRLSRKELSESVERHGGMTKNAVNIALSNIRDLVDDDGSGNWKLRELGRQKAARMMNTLHI